MVMTERDGGALGLSYVSDLAFGRNLAQYRAFIAFLATISVALGIVVLLTTCIRWGARHIWYRHYPPAQAAKPSEIRTKAEP